MLSTAATAALLFAVSPLAHAAIDIKSAVDLEATTKIEAGTAKTGSGASAGAKMETGTQGEVHTMGAGETMVGGEHAEDTDSEEESADVLGDIELSIDLDVEGDKHAVGTAEVDTAAKVKSKHDFEDFVHHKSKGDAHLKGVEVEDGKVEVAYVLPAKFFGFMKTTLTTHVSVDANDTVEVKYAWYHIFMKKHVTRASMQSNIARAVAAERKGIKEGMATTTIQADIQAAMGIPNLFEIIANELKSTRVKAEAEASGSVEKK